MGLSHDLLHILHSLSFIVTLSFDRIKFLIKCIWNGVLFICYMHDEMNFLMGIIVCVKYQKVLGSLHGRLD
jgi:hypothetical protein